MTSILVLYASTHGQTGKIARHIANDLAGADTDVDVRRVEADAAFGLDAYDGVVIGASVHGGHHQREMLDWVTHHAISLNRIPTAFFSVSLSAAEDTDEARTANRDYVEDFLEDTGLTPRLKVSFAGALQYLEYDFMTRLVMRLMMARGNHPTDTTRDHEYTDWHAVDAFAGDVKGLLGTHTG